MHCDGTSFVERAALMVVQCLKYKTDQASDVKAMEKLNNLFFTLMSSKKLDSADVQAMDGTRCAMMESLPPLCNSE